MIDGDDGRPDFRYARTKAAGEQLALEAAADGLDVVVANPGFAIGPGDVHRVSSWPVEEYLRGRLRFTIDGGLSYVDARDIAAGLLLLEERGRTGERYILTNDEGNLSHRDFFARVGRVTGKPRRQLHLSKGILLPLLRAGTALRLPLPLDADELASSSRWWFYTAAKARSELGFETRPLDDTIRDTANWLARRRIPPPLRRKSHGSQVPPVQRDVGQDQRPPVLEGAEGARRRGGRVRAGPALGLRFRRPEVAEMTGGPKALPIIEFEDGSLLRDST